MYLSLESVRWADNGKIIGTHHGAEGNKANQGKCREEVQADDNRITESLEIIGIEACVNHEEKYWRHLSRTAKRVLDGRVLGQQLCRKICTRKVFVVGRECVACEAERTNP